MTKARDTGEVLNTRGTAATADVQTSPTDATAGALMAVGAFGLASSAQGASLDCDSFLTSGEIAHSAGITNGPSGATFGYVICNYYTPSNSGRAVQTMVQTSGNGTWQRVMANGVWVDVGLNNGWKPVYNGTNLVEAQNVSGSTVLGSGQTAGSNLVPAQTGNWSPSTDTLNNAYNIWVKQ